MRGSGIRVSLSLAVAPVGPSRSRLITETRTRGADERARAAEVSSLLDAISPFALTRRLVLNEVATEASRR